MINVTNETICKACSVIIEGTYWIYNPQFYWPYCHVCKTRMEDHGWTSGKFIEYDHNSQ